MTVQFLVYVVTTLFTYIAGKVSKHFGWNYTMPITIQIILIIASASIIGCVITAVGGFGTAVVAYDAKNQ